MANVNGGMLLVLSSPSGGGKSTLGQKTIARLDNLRYSVSYTTRSPRAGEQDGTAYNFISFERFSLLIDEGFFLEWERVHGNFYGTGKKNIQEILASGHDVLLDIDVKGAQQVRKQLPGQVVTVFVLPPSMVVLESRLRSRATDDEEVIAGRLKNAVEEIGHCQSYDYLVVNDDLDAAVARLASIIIAERCRMSRQQAFLKRSGYV
ncbi:MAG: guanylate kinase [Deltaproteobacteria bacterium]|nr:guanylate kinase [Candidatus Anaeroferrophillus wilburensis]MBN2888670.1 guanylate kinase [Deltaproteobacteria bacterium]